MSRSHKKKSGVDKKTHGLKENILKYLLPFLAILGLFISLKLTLIYLNNNFFDAAHKSFCTLNEVINCDDVSSSPYSSFLGIPNSIYGMLFYIAVLVLGVLNIKPDFLRSLKNTKSIIHILSVLAIGISVYLAVVSAFILNKFCLLCIATYLINIVIFFVSKEGKGVIEHYKNARESILYLASKKFFAEFFLALFLAFTVGVYYADKVKVFSAKKLKHSKVAKIFNKAELIGNVLGSKQPKIIINEYTDFECPFCAILHSHFARLVKEVDGVLVIHRDYPLSQPCNPSVKSSLHKNSCIAAYYSRAAKNQGKYWDFISLLFDHQGQLSEENI